MKKPGFVGVLPEVLPDIDSFFCSSYSATSRTFYIMIVKLRDPNAEQGQCSHLVCCVQCAASMSACPLCGCDDRTSIKVNI